MSEKPRILWCSQSMRIHTGYGITTNDILTRLMTTDKYEIAHLVWEDIIADKPKYPCEARYSEKYPVQTFAVIDKPEEIHRPMGRVAAYNPGKFDEVVKYFKPDIVVQLSDLYMTPWFNELETRQKFKLVYYYPVDGIPMPEVWGGYLKPADRHITFSGKFGIEATKETIGIEPINIPIGIDFSFWSQKLDQKSITSIREDIFKIKDPFIYGMVSRNQPRKNIPGFLEAFAIHAKRNTKARAWLHCAKMDLGWNLDRLLQEFQCKDRVFITPDITPNKGVPTDKLRNIYQCFDVHVNTSWGEGQGCPILESMACGTPQILPNYTVMSDFIKESEAGLTFKIGYYLVEHISHVRRAMPDPVNLITIMDKISSLEYKPTLNKMRAKATTYAKTYDWTYIIPQWTIVLDGLLADKDKHILRLEEL